MNDMFDGCSSLKKLDISNFSISDETNMSQIFSGCTSLEEIIISNIINNVPNIKNIFLECLSELNKKIKLTAKENI